jgi:uncharacterized protein involved in exopolysaccharide biosynthesis
MSFRQIGGLALLGVGLVFILLGIYLNLQKPMYRAAALIKVAPETTAQIGAENGKITLTMSDPYLTQNVFEEIQSGPVLTKVVEDLGLDNEWGKRYNLVESPHRTAEIIALLKGKIGFRPIRNTMFLEIGCLSENPEEAKEIVNSVARAYQQFRLEQLKRGSLGTLKVLEERWKEQEDQVRKAQSEVDRLREEHNIPDMRTGEPTTAMLMSAETLRKLEGMRIELESQAMRDENLFATYKGLPREKLLNVLPTTAPDPLLNSLLEQRTFCEQALIVKRHDFGAEHLEVVKLKTQLENLQSKINDRLDGVLLGIEGRLKSEREQLTKLKDEVETAKARDIAAIKETQPYWEAKRKLEDLQRFSQVLAMKVASESVEASLPKKMLVEIMNDALTPRRPIYPNRFQAAAMIVLGILLDLAGLRLIRARPHLLTPVLQPS